MHTEKSQCVVIPGLLQRKELLDRRGRTRVTHGRRERKGRLPRNPNSGRLKKAPPRLSGCDGDDDDDDDGDDEGDDEYGTRFLELSQETHPDA